MSFNKVEPLQSFFSSLLRCQAESFNFTLYGQHAAGKLFGKNDVGFAVTLSLRKIDARNLRAACRLDFRPGQEEFVRSPARSIASAYVREYGDRYEYLRLGIYDAEIMIGYAGLLCDPESDNDYWVGEIMIDAQHQSRGYGRAAMREIIAHLRRNYPKCGTIQLTCHRDNRNAEALYLSLGFIKTGQLNPESGHPLYALTGAALADIAKV